MPWKKENKKRAAISVLLRKTFTVKSLLYTALILRFTLCFHCASYCASHCASHCASQTQDTATAEHVCSSGSLRPDAPELRGKLAKLNSACLNGTVLTSTTLD